MSISSDDYLGGMTYEELLVKLSTDLPTQLPGLVQSSIGSTTYGQPNDGAGLAWESSQQLYVPSSSVPKPGDLVWSLATSRAGCVLADGTAYTLSAHPELKNLATAVPAIVSAGVLTIPDIRGRGVIGAGAGSGLTARTLLQVLGEETHLLTAAESGLPSHGHPSNGAESGNSSTVTNYGTDWVKHVSDTGYTIPAYGNEYAGGSNASTAHNNMQPSIALNPFVVY